MARQLIECVPNFSEGRDVSKVDAIAGAMLAASGVALLDRELDADHNRSVITIAGPPEAVAEAAFRGVAKAVELIDLTKHQGVHPRIGAADVVPFVPVEGVTLDECVKLAERLGERIWAQLKVPVYLYESAARRPQNTNLENIRRGEFEGLREEVKTNAERHPDFGEAAFHPTAGATVVGARNFLIAYNINLGTPDVEIAKRIAKSIRFSSGGFRYVKAMGVALASRNLAQVSMNLTDFEQTPIHRVFEAVRVEAERYGVPIVGSEIIGLIPKKALEMTAEFYLRVENFNPGLVLENRLAETMERKNPLGEFLDALAAPSAAPGGGSAAAAAGAMAAALGCMIARLAKFPHEEFEEARRFLLEAADRESAAFNGVMAAFNQPREERSPVVQAALKQAALVPLEVLECVAPVREGLEKLLAEAPAKFASDAKTGKALADAAVLGALANININLGSIKDEEFAASVRERVAALNLY